MILTILSPRGSIRWEDSDYVVLCGPRLPLPSYEFEGIELGVDGPTLKAMRKLASKQDHASRSVLNAACGALGMSDGRSRVYDEAS
eukprot:2114407-Amphidinium_carterae.2